MDYENGLNRKQVVDTRIHCCFYFISPIGYGLKPLDIQAMKALGSKVNLIPIIGRADALTRQEIVDLKEKILKEIRAHGINIYSLPDCDSDEEEDYKEQIKSIKNSIPFAISSSNENVDSNDRKCKGRAYPWGVVETENAEHSDFVKLKSLLVTHMQDLREVTHEVHYENYREERLRERSSLSSQATNDSCSSEERERKLQAKEEELKRMAEQLAQLKSAINQENGDYL